MAARRENISKKYKELKVNWQISRRWRNEWKDEDENKTFMYVWSVMKWEREREREDKSEWETWSYQKFFHFLARVYFSLSLSITVAPFHFMCDVYVFVCIYVRWRCIHTWDCLSVCLWFILSFRFIRFRSIRFSILIISTRAALVQFVYCHSHFTVWIGKLPISTAHIVYVYRSIALV